MIVISQYQPEWVEEFEMIRASLNEAVGDLALRIDHIGSTSVPGLGAKDVIDIQITVSALDDEVRQALRQSGYQERESVRHDHVPKGEDEDPERWEKFFFNNPEGQRPANIHVRAAENPNQSYPLLFRDYLRAHPNSVMTLELIKREIAKRHANNVDAYYDIKDPVYDLIREAAIEWSGSRGSSD